MRTTVDLDEELFNQAMVVTKARTKTECIELGLKALVEQDSRRRLVALRGKIPELKAAPRRRLSQ
jgi:Arc/MetJ family transcription regulator